MGGATAGDEPIRIPIEDSIDLHAFAPADVRSVVDDYLHEAHARGFREVRVIHGRGIGAQRASVRAFLEGHPLVARYADAPPERGGWGATIAHLIDMGGPERAPYASPRSSRPGEPGALPDPGPGS